MEMEMELSNMAMNYKIVHERERERGDFDLNVSPISLPSSLDFLQYVCCQILFLAGLKLFMYRVLERS